MEKDDFTAYVISQGYDLEIDKTQLSFGARRRLKDLGRPYVSNLNAKDIDQLHNNLGPAISGEVTDFVILYDVCKYLPNGVPHKLLETMMMAGVKTELAAGRSVPVLSLYLSKAAKVCLLSSGFTSLDSILRLTQEDFESLSCLNNDIKKEVLHLFTGYELSFREELPKTIEEVKVSKKEMENYEKLKKQVKAERFVHLGLLNIPLKTLKKIHSAGWSSVRDMTELSRKYLKEQADLSDSELDNVEEALKSVGLRLADLTIEETKVTTTPEPFPYPTPIGCEPLPKGPMDKIIKIQNACASKETAIAYIKSRQDDANRLCIDMLTGNIEYCEVKTFKSNDGEVLYRVKGCGEGVEPGKSTNFVAEDRERILAFILAMWW